MLRQMSRRARLDAFLHDRLDDGLTELSDILHPLEVPADHPSTPLKPTEVAGILAKAPQLEDVEYNALLQYLQLTGRPYQAFYNLPHPRDANILPPHAQQLLQIHRGECTFSCEKSHKGNSAIFFYNPLTQTHDTGFIQTIWSLPLEGLMQTFLVVRPHQSLSGHEEGMAPFSHYPGFKTRIVDLAPSGALVIIETSHIVTHLTTFQRPARTYGISRESLVVCWALNRGRR